MRVKLHSPTFGEEEIAAVVEVMRSTNVTQGEKVRSFEDTFARMFGHKNAVACNSGSSANLLVIASMVALGRLNRGDEVIVSALSWSTTVFPLIQYGLIPVFVDCDPETLNIDVEAVKRAWSPKTKAVMPVHVYGNPCDMDGLIDMPMIEDCCEAMGASFYGVPVGRFGQAGTFSFYFSHHITTLEGGMVVTEDDELADMMRIQRSHGWQREAKKKQHVNGIDDRFLFVDLGYNLRLSEPMAAMGLIQLDKLAGFIERRRALLAIIKDRLKDSPVKVQREIGRSSAFGAALLGPPGMRDALEGIETRPIIAGNLARHPAILKHPHRVAGTLDVADAVLRNGFAVPCHQGMTDEDAHFIADSILKIL
jgi:CDP-6-deoxy-D-xylo-4-hexulose-3-dehydrase